MKKNIITLLGIISLNTLAAGNMGGLDPDHNPVYRNRYVSYKNEVSKCEISTNGKYYHLNKKNNSLEEIFSLIETTSIGASIISQIRSLIENKSLLIKDLSYSVRQFKNIPAQTAALYDFTESTPSIYIDFKDELGLVAHFFVHEAVHALDEVIPVEYEEDLKTYEAYKKIYDKLGLNTDPMKELTEDALAKIQNAYDFKESLIDKHAYRAERLAFNVQGQFTSEILSNDNCYSLYVENHTRENRLKLYINTPDEHIFSSYRIDPKNI